MSARCLVPIAAVATALAILGTTSLAGVAGAAQPTPMPRPDFGTTPCVATPRTDVQPGTFLVGDSVAVTQSVRVRCAASPLLPMHVVLVLDGTAAMAKEPREELRALVDAFVASLEPELRGTMRMAVVVFGDDVRTVCPLTDRVARLRACVRRVGATGAATIGAGLREGERALAAGRDDWPGLRPEHLVEALILVSAGREAAGCEDALREAARLAEQGVDLYAVCVGSDCDVRCMSALASDPRHFFDARTLPRLRDVLAQVRAQSRTVGIRWMTITETLPADVVLVGGSVHPPAAIDLRQPVVLVWTVSGAAADGFTATYRVAPRTPGYRPLSAGAEGAFADTRDLRGRFAFDVPWARVLGGLPSDGP